jgi:hypothetical protein
LWQISGNITLLIFGLNIDPARKNLQEEQQQATLFAEEIVPGVREQLRSS